LARAHPSPRRQVPCGGKGGHVGADAGEDDLPGAVVDPGIAVSGSTWPTDGANTDSIRSSTAAMSASWASTWSGIRSTGTVVLAESAGQGCLRSGILVRTRALANSAKAALSLWPPISARIMARPDTLITSARQIAGLMPMSWSTLWIWVIRAVFLLISALRTGSGHVAGPW